MFGGFFREKPIGSVIYMKSKLDRGLGNLWTSRSLIQWVILRGQMLLVCAIFFHEIFHDKWRLHKSIRQTENGLERSSVKHWLNSA